MSGKVTSVGSLNLDLTYLLERLPEPGETLLSESFQRRCGGKGANQAAAAAAAGAQVTMLGAVGRDDAGELMLSDLRERGVNTDSIGRCAAVSSGSAVILRDAGSGENVIVVDPGANGELRPAGWDASAIRDADVVLSQLEVPLDTVTAAADLCRGSFILNIAPWQPLPAGLIEQLDVLVANQTEIASLAAAPPPTTLETTAGLLKSAALPCAVIVTVGGEGAVVYDPQTDDCVEVPAPAVQVVDTTGAGDCFCGVLGARMAAGAGLVQAAREAVIGASLSTQAAGARGRLPTLAEIRDSLSHES